MTEMSKPKRTIKKLAKDVAFITIGGLVLGASIAANVGAQREILKELAEHRMNDLEADVDSVINGATLGVPIALSGAAVLYGISGLLRKRKDDE